MHLTGIVCVQQTGAVEQGNCKREAIDAALHAYIKRALGLFGRQGCLRLSGEDFLLVADRGLCACWWLRLWGKHLLCA